MSKNHIPPPTKAASVELFKGASFLSVKLRQHDSCQRQPPKRGEINCFSASSRRRMLDLMAKIETAQVPVFVTLTYPNSFPLYSHEFKRHLEVFCARLVRRWPGAAVIWKLEFKERKSGENKGKIAPHYHLLIYGVPWEFPFKAERGRRVCVSRQVENDSQLWRVSIDKRVMSVTCTSVFDAPGLSVELTNRLCGDTLRDWVSRNWYDVVDSGDLRHFHAGTRVERLRTVKGAFAYAAKHYVVKRETLAAMPHQPGRFWGVVNRKCLKLGERQQIELTEKQAVQLRRCIRRYRRANTPPEKRRWLRKGGLFTPEFTVKLYCRVDFWLERLPGLIGNFPCNFPLAALLYPRAEDQSLNAGRAKYPDKFPASSFTKFRPTLPEADRALSDQLDSAKSSPPWHHGAGASCAAGEIHSTNHV